MEQRPSYRADFALDITLNAEMKGIASYLGAFAGIVVLAGAAFLWERQAVAQQTIECVDKKACLPSYRNTAICEGLAAGISERELIFRLGQPIGEYRLSLRFEAGATERGPIEVEIDEFRNARKFYCRGRA
jgi:hypothetical protein